METIRVWRRSFFTLRVFDTGDMSEGKHRLAYVFSDGEHPDGQQLFSGSNFYASPLHAIDSDEALASILSFIALGEGDTDSDYFNDYTDKQLGWRDSPRREELAMLVYEMEEGGTDG
jgi:hypothetical protein